MSEWPGGREGRLENRVIEVRSTNGQSWEREKRWQELKRRSDKWENKSSDKGEVLRGHYRRRGGCVGVKDLWFFSSTYEIL